MRLLRAVVDHPVAAGGLLLGLTLFFALQLPRLRIDSSAAGLMIERDPARTYYEAMKQKFGSDAATAILIRADDVFTIPVLRVVKQMTETLEGMDGVIRVESLTTVRNIRGDADTISTEPLIGPRLPSEAELARIKPDALANRILVGNIVSSDARATAIVCYTAGGMSFNAAFTDRVEALIRELASPGISIVQMGEPFTKITLERSIEKDMVTVGSMSIAVLFLMLLLTMRTATGVLVPLVTGGVSIVWALGAMALANIPLNAMTGMVPSLLIVIGFTEDIHMLAHYDGLRRAGTDTATAIREMLADTNLPILVTTATTVAGFLSLVLTDIPMVVQFGWATTIGLVANYVVTLIGLPAMLAVWPTSSRARPVTLTPAGGPRLLPRLVEHLIEFIPRHRVAIWVVSGLLVAGSLTGWATLRVDTDFMSYFPERSVIRQRADELHRALAGAVVFYLVVETGTEDGVREPRVLQAIAELQDFLQGTGEVDKTVSLADYIRKMHREMNAGDPASEIIPDSKEQIAQYLLLLEGNELEKYVDFNGSTANIVVRHNIMSSWRLSKLLKRIDAHTRATFPAGARVRATGEIVLVNAAADYIAMNELTSFGWTLAVIAAIHAILFMSVKAGLLSIVPNVIPVVYIFGIMGLFDIPLNTATAVVAAVAIGITVDDTVHHMVVYNRELNVHNDQKIAMANTLRSQAPPIIYVSLALAAGFFTLMAGTLRSFFYIGLLSGVVMLLAMATELLLTPLLMSSTRLVTLWNILQLKMSRDLVHTSPLLHGLSRWEARKVVLLGGLRSLAPGEFIIRKGEVGDNLFMLVSGRARVFDVDSQHHEHTLGTLTPGAVFGEMAILSDGIRSANVVAESNVEVLRLSRAALESVRRRFPFTAAKLYRNIAIVLSDRLRERTRLHDSIEVR